MEHKEILITTNLMNPHYMLNYQLYYQPYIELIYNYFNGYIFEKDLKAVVNMMLKSNEYECKRDINRMVEENFLDKIKVRNMNLLKIKKNALIAYNKNKNQADYKMPTMRQIMRSTLKANVILNNYPVSKSLGNFNKKSKYSYLVEELYAQVYLQYIDNKRKNIVLSIFDLKNYSGKDFSNIFEEIYLNHYFNTTIEFKGRTESLKEFGIKIYIYTYCKSRKDKFSSYFKTNQELKDYSILWPRIKEIGVVNLDISNNYFAGSEVLL